MIGEFLTVVIGQRVNVCGMWGHGRGHRGTYCCRCFIFCSDDQAEPALAFDERDEHRTALSANDGISFPIADP